MHLCTILCRRDIKPEQIGLFVQAFLAAKQIR